MRRLCCTETAAHESVAAFRHLLVAARIPIIHTHIYVVHIVHYVYVYIYIYNARRSGTDPEQRSVGGEGRGGVITRYLINYTTIFFSPQTSLDRLTDNLFYTDGM